jgi:DNA-binding MarR family transcriptional regulator
MAAKNKRRRLPEEDLEASIQDILQSPITKVNLSFLNTDFGDGPAPGAVSNQPVVEPVTDGMGSVLNPMGVKVDPSGLESLVVPGESGVGSNPMGVGSEPVHSGPTHAGSQELRTDHTLWRAEHLGAFFEGSRVRPINRAEDALSVAEQRVYELLWTTGTEGGDDYRLVHCSLQRISSQLKLNIKTVRELLPRMAEKGFIAVEREADVRRNIATLYRVWSGRAILAAQQGFDRRWVVKTGRGVFYVHKTTVSVTGG